MLAINQPYTLLLAFAAILTAALAVYTLRHRPNLGTRSFSAVMTAVSLWAFVSLFEVCSLDPKTKIFSYQIKYLFIVMVPLSWLTFSLYYSNRLRKLELRYLVMLFIVPAVTLLLVATNHYHQLMFSKFEIVEVNGYRMLYPGFGSLFWLHTGYSYAIITAAFFLLAQYLLNSPSHFQRQVTYLMIGGLPPWLFNIMFILKIGNFTYFDLTPVAFTITGVAFMWGVMRYRLLDIVPIARDVVIHNMRDGVIVVDGQDQIIDLNKAARRLTGIKENNIIGVQAGNIIPWWHMLDHLKDSAAANSSLRFELDVQGRSRIIEVGRSVLADKEKALGFMITLRDDTANQKVEKALRESEERFRSLSENAPVIIFSMDENGALDYVNPAWKILLGYSRQEVIGHHLVDFVPEDQNRTMADTFDQLIKGQSPVAELKLHLVHKDGSRHLFDTSASANSDTMGRVTGIIGLAKDITGEAQLHQQLIQSQKMEAVGTLAGGMAHDFNNLLMGMQANMSLIRMEAGKVPTITEKIKRVEDQIQVGASLTRQLLGYARKGKYTVSIFDLNVLIKETLSVVHRTNKKITVNTLLADSPAFIRADRGQMELVLLNLFINAIDAMPKGGELIVTTNRQRTNRANSGQIIRVDITDNGIGMEPSILDRIFEPFFTTKERGEGTGLGLASVYGVVQNHEGSIEAHSEPNKGSTFVLKLPVARDPQYQHPDERDSTALPTGDGKILLVDDDPIILKYSYEMVTSLGFSVLSAQTADDALKIFKDLWQTIDLVILDLVMPEVDGMQLLEQMQKIKPNVQVIVTTGYAMDDRISKLISSGRHDYLKKPYSRGDLARAIGGLVAQTPDAPKTGEAHSF